MVKRVLYVVVIFFFLSLFLLFNSQNSFVQTVTGVVQSLTSVPRSLLFKQITQNTDSAEVMNLKKQNEQLQNELYNYNLLKSDNAALHNQFEDTQISSQNLLPADIIGITGAIDHPTEILINRGKYDKVGQGMGVVVGHNLVGKVQTISNHFSKVMTVNNQNFTALVKTLQDNSSGIIHGENDFLLLTNVVITDKLTKGDFVETKGNLNSSGNVIYSNIIVGKINSISKQENQPYQSAKIESLIDYSKLNNVFVIMSK